MVARTELNADASFFRAAVYQWPFVERAPMRMAGATGLGPSASCVTGNLSGQPMRRKRELTD
jgi:hypothetical protein